MNRVGEAVTVRKFDPAGREMFRWQGTLRRAKAGLIQVEARFNGLDGVLGGLAFRHGDRFLESYYLDRWYNVFAVYDPDSGSLKGWYCNASRPARLQDGEVLWVDLALDVIVLPDGSSAVVDEDEFVSLRLPEDEAVAARAAVAELLGHARLGTGPFVAPT